MRMCGLLIMILVFGTSLFAQNKEKIKGSGNVITEEREIPAFSSVEFEGAYDILIKQSEDKEELKIEADDNLLKYIKTKVTNAGVLIVSVDEDVNISDFDEMNIYLTCVDLGSLKVSGAAQIENIGGLKLEKFALEISGAADVELNIFADKFKADLSGATNIELSGKVAEAKIEISGVGNLKALEMEVGKLKIDISGAGNAEVFVKEALDVSISGLGNVSYKGDPSKIKKDITLFGHLDKL